MVTEERQSDLIQGEAISGAIIGIFGALAALELFAIVQIVGKPISYLGNLEFSLAYAILVSVPAVFVASLVIHKTRTRSTTLRN